MKRFLFGVLILVVVGSLIFGGCAVPAPTPPPEAPPPEPEPETPLPESEPKPETPLLESEPEPEIPLPEPEHEPEASPTPAQPALPDLTFFIPEGWSEPIVAGNAAMVLREEAMADDKQLYIGAAITNAGEKTAENFIAALGSRGNPLKVWRTPEIAPGEKSEMDKLY